MSSKTPFAVRAASDIEPVIRVERLTKSYRLYERPVDRIKEIFHPLRKQYHRTHNALTDVSLNVQPGQTIGIVGRNGSGKSTLLQLICGILQPTSGKIYTQGRISALLELGAGFSPDFTGRQNVFINASILGLSHEETEACFDDILAFAGVRDYIDQPVRTYSSGMYVRLAFATAIHVRPEILVVDEALAVGDALFQAKCFAKFREFQEKGVTILFVTHSLNLITTYCSHAFLLECGRLWCGGPAKEVVDEYNRLIVNCSQPIDASSGGEMLALGECACPLPVNPDENRYGDRRAEIFSTGIFDLDGTPCQTLQNGHQYEFRLKARFLLQVNEPVLAFTIKDLRGLELCGTNTLFQKVEIGRVEAGQVLEVVFQQYIRLNAGSYLLSFGCAGFEGDAYTVFDRRYDHLVFEVVSERDRVGFFDPCATIRVHRI